MKVNTQFDITDSQRNKLACQIDGKLSKRMVSRKDVTALAQGWFNSLLDAETFVAVKQERTGTGIVKCPACTKAFETEEGQDHVCSCGTTFIAKSYN